MESVWNVIKTANDKNLLYKDYKVVPWCPRCGTTLSSHELAQGYEDVKDLSLTAKFKIVGEENTFILAWTTTPWTLPGNVALAVGNDINYVKVGSGDKKNILRLWFYVAGLAILFFSAFGIYTAWDKPFLLYNTLRIFSALALTWLVINFGERKNLTQSLIVAAAICSLWGWTQFASQTATANKWLGLAEHSASTPGVAVFITENARLLRSYGPLDHPNVLGGLLAIALMLLISYKLFKPQVINWSLAILLSIGLFFSGSRSAWLATGLGLIAVLISKILKKERSGYGVIVATVFTGIILIIPFWSLISPRLSAVGRLENISINERREQLNQVIKIIKTQPLGVSSGQYTTYLSRQDNNRQTPSAYQPVHNVFLLVFAESGFFAFVSLILFLGFLLLDKRRQQFSLAIVVAMTIIMMIDHWLFSLPFGILFFFLILGLI
jgi:O-antigen ligase